MNNRFLLGCVLFLTFGYVHAQESRLLSGRVVAQDKDVVGVVVQNTNTQNAVITDLEGRFAIPVRVGDILVFSAVQFKKKIFPISTDIYNTEFVTVPLEEFVNELREVIVTPFNLSGNLGEDLNGLQLEKDVSAEALGLPNAEVRIVTQSERKLHEASSGLYSFSRPLAVGLNPLINALTGRTKMLKKRVKVDKTYARTQRVQEFYVDSLFVTTLKIPREKIDDFMYYCEVDEGFQQVVDSRDKLRILDFMILKSRAYRNDNKLD